MDSTAKDSKVKKYVALFALILAGSTIYELPYLSHEYFKLPAWPVDEYFWFYLNDWLLSRRVPG